MKTEKALLREKAAVYGLAAMSDKELMTILGWKGEPSEFWESKEFQFMKELTRRRETKHMVKITNSGQSYDHFRFLEDYSHEEFHVMYLTQNNTILAIKQVNTGGVNATVVDTQKIIRQALELKRCTALILCHNHPSGAVRPSDNDKKLTEKLKSAAALMEIQILDHIIIGNGYFSFADEGLI